MGNPQGPVRKALCFETYLGESGSQGGLLCQSGNQRSPWLSQLIEDLCLYEVQKAKGPHQSSLRGLFWLLLEKSAVPPTLTLSPYPFGILGLG